MNITHYRKPQIERPARGRPRLYDDEQRKQRHREAALAAYHKSGRTTRASREPCYFYTMGEAQRGTN